MPPLEGVRVLVTGGTTGLGRAMAEALVRVGARVAVTSRKVSRAEAAAAELGGDALGLELDVRDEASVSAAVDTVYAAFGGVDVLDPAIMGPPIVWLASAEAAGVHNERIVASTFDEWLRDRPA